MTDNNRGLSTTPLAILPDQIGFTDEAFIAETMVRPIFFLYYKYFLSTVKESVFYSYLLSAGVVLCGSRKKVFPGSLLCRLYLILVISDQYFLRTQN